MKRLKFKNDIIPGYFIDQNGKIYDVNGQEQKQIIYESRPYYHFKGKGVHVLMCHSFFGYKEGFDIHHLNECKTDNRLENLVYLTHAEHTKLHKKAKAVYCPELNKVFESIHAAARELSLYPDSIIKCCKGKRKTCGRLPF